MSENNRIFNRRHGSEDVDARSPRRTRSAACIAFDIRFVGTNSYFQIVVASRVACDTAVAASVNTGIKQAISSLTELSRTHVAGRLAGFEQDLHVTDAIDW